MAEKRVSVRLVAEGGRQVRAELEGIGDAGARGFGRLSSEMELANARLGSFARKAGIALAAVTFAAAAAGVAMIRSGLSNVDAQAKLAQSMRTTVESVQTLTWAGELAGVSMGEIEQATKKLTTRLSEAATGSGSAVGALQRLNLTAAQLQALPLDQRIIAIQEALNQFVPEAERAAVASDLFGDKAALAFLRIDSATLREAAQDVRDFGVAVSASDASQIERTGDAIARLSLIWIGLTNRLTVAAAPALEAVANALADMAHSTGPIGIAITTLFDNIGRLTTYAATFAALMAGRWVAGLAAAALSVRGLATGLVFLRGALIRTGIGALIVGAGELVFQFTRLVAGAGGFGAAIGLMKDLAFEVWDRIGLGAASAWSKIEASWAGLQATVYLAMQSSVEAVTSFGNSAAGIFKGAYDAVKAIWGQLPSAIGDFAFQAANGLISGVEAMLNGVVTRINNFINGLNAALDLLPDWAVGEGGVKIGTLDPVALGRIDNPFEGSAAAAGTAAAKAFSAAMAQTYVTTPDLGLTGMAEDATFRAEAYREASGMLADAATRPMQSWQALKDAVAGAGTEGEAALNGATDAADRLDESVTEAGRAAGGAGAAAAAGAEVAKTGWKAAVATLADYAAKARDIGGDIGNALVAAFTSAENAVGEFVKTGKLDFRDLVTSMIADLVKLAARRFILGPIANALSGALSGAGGLFANILHAGAVVGSPGPGRMVPAMAFANAPRMHAGGWAGIKPDEVPAILQRGERVLSRREAAGYGQTSTVPSVNVTIMSRDAESFRQSRTQVAADIGCPAIDRGTNQPNVFFDPKSSESFTPYFSRGWRDDAIQRAYIEATYLFWGVSANNPISGMTGARMVTVPECAAWTWDARPYPFFPELTTVWTDGPNWRRGHWLTGRLGAVSLAALVRHLCLRAGMPEAQIDVSGLWGAIEGYVISALEAPRASISTLARHFGFDAIESEGRIMFLMRGRIAGLTITPDSIVASTSAQGDVMELTRAQETELPQALKWQVARADEDYDAAQVEARRITVDTTRIASEAFPMAVPPEEAERRCRRALMEAWVGRESAVFRLPPSGLALDPCDVILLDHDGRLTEMRLVSIADSDLRSIDAVRQDRAVYDLPPGDPRPASLSTPMVFGAPDVMLLDLPQLREDQPAHRPLAAAYAKPWPGEMAVYRSAATDGFALLTTFGGRARIGALAESFYAGPVSRFDLGNALVVDLFSGTLESVTDIVLLGGANALAVETGAGQWEIIQAGNAELIAPGRYRLTRLLRGQRGTENAVVSLVPTGARVIVLDATLASMPIAEADLGLPWNWRIGPASKSVSDDTIVAIPFTPEGAGLRPFSVGHVEQPWRTARNPGDLTIRWTRRSRSLAADTWGAGDVPLAEDSETYEVEIRDGGTTKRTLTTTTTSVLYTAAHQTADWGAPLGPGQTLTIRIFQLSALIGRGAGRSVTLTF